MQLNPQLLQINKNVLICLAISISCSAIGAQLLEDQENYLTTTISILIGYVSYFGVFSCLFYWGNKERYKTMKSKLIRKELLGVITSLSAGELICFIVLWASMFFFLEMGLEPFLSSLISEIITTVIYLPAITLILVKTKTFS